MADVTLDDGTKGALDGMGDAMNEGAGTALYAIGTPVVIAGLAAAAMLLLFQALHTMMGTRDGRWAAVAAWALGGIAALVALGVLAGRWDDPQIGQPLYGYQQTLKWVAAGVGAAFGMWITTLVRSNNRGY